MNRQPARFDIERMDKKEGTPTTTVMDEYLKGSRAFESTTPMLRTKSSRLQQKGEYIESGDTQHNNVLQLKVPFNGGMQTIEL